MSCFKRAPLRCATASTPAGGARKGSLSTSFHGPKGPFFHRARCLRLVFFRSLRYAARRPGGARKVFLGFLPQTYGVCSTPWADNFFAAADTFFARKRPFFLDSKANKMIKLEIRSRAEKWAVDGL